MIRLTKPWFLFALTCALLCPSFGAPGSGWAASFGPPGLGASPAENALWKNHLLKEVAARFLPGHSRHPLSGATLGKAVSNSYVGITLSDDPFAKISGNFGMGTTSAYPNNPADNNQPLIYGWPDYEETTYSSAYVNGNFEKYGDRNGTIQLPPTIIVPGEELGMAWLYRNVDIQCTLTLVDSLEGVPETCKITYRAKNLGSPRPVGFRIMLDTFIGGNDGAPINVVGQPYSAFEQTYSAANMPQYWQAFQGSPGNPGLTAQGTLYGGEATKPDKFVVAFWPGIYNAVWDYNTVSTQLYDFPDANTSDSAVAMWWNPQTLQTGESAVFTTYYGLGQGVTCQNSLGVNFTAPAQVGIQDCNYSPNPFQAQLVVQNEESFQVNDIQATLQVPPGLTLVSPALVSLGSLAPQAQQNAAWTIMATGNPTGTLEMNLTVTSTNGGTCFLTKAIIVPLINCTPTPTGTPTGTYTPVPTSTQTPTPTTTPTPTLNPTPPVIYAAGWGNTQVTTQHGGTATLTAWILPGGSPISQVELLAGGGHTGLYMTLQNGFYTFTTDLPPGIAAGLYLLEVSALDANGNTSDPWPYVSIRPSGTAFGGIPGDFYFPRQTGVANPGAPYVDLAGYLANAVNTGNGGELELGAEALPAAETLSLPLYFQGLLPTGVSLSMNGLQGYAASPGIYGFSLAIQPGTTLTPTILELQATDLTGSKSDIWPYLNIREEATATPTQTPTPVPSQTPTLTPTLTPTSTPTLTPSPTPAPNCCFTIDPPVQTSGSWVNVNASCSTYSGGGQLLYSWSWGDNTPSTDYSTNPQAQHVYTSPNNSGYVITLTVKAPSGAVCSLGQTVKIIP